MLRTELKWSDYKINLCCKNSETRSNTSKLMVRLDEDYNSHLASYIANVVE